VRKLVLAIVDFTCNRFQSSMAPIAENMSVDRWHVEMKRHIASLRT